MEALLQQTLSVGLAVKAVKSSSLKRVSVDTTVQPRAITHPPDSKLLNRRREHVVKLAKKQQQSDSSSSTACINPTWLVSCKGKAHKKYEET